MTPAAPAALIFLAILSLIAAGAAVVAAWGRRQERSLVLSRLGGAAEEAGVPVSQLLREKVLSEIPAVHRLLSERPLAHRLNNLLEQADVSMRVGTFLLLSLALAGVGWLLGGALARDLLLRLLVTAGPGLLPLAVVLYKRRKRTRAFTEQFPDALDMMTNGLRAGYAFNGAIQVVAEEMPDPMGLEFGRAFEEQNLGLALKEALLGMCRRVDSLDLRFFVTAVLIQRESGGNLAEVLEKIGYTIRERFKIKRQVRAFTAQGRLTGMVLGVLPVVMGFFLYQIDPGYLGVLFHTPLGQRLLGGAIVLQIIGFIVIRKIISIRI